MAGTDNATRGGRRIPLRPSWLDRVRDASAAAVGVARDVTDLGAADTSPRTPAYPVEADLEVDEALFGEPPSGKLRGTATLPPGERDGSSFPPDLLRETSFWDEAEPGTSGRVLALVGDGEPIVRSLGDDDPLADDVKDVRRWVEEAASADDVVADLGRRAAGPVAFAAGFHLVVSEDADPAATFGRFRSLPRAGAGALAGVIERLRIDASSWDDATVADVGEALAAGWKEERDPATIAAYVTWFDVFQATVLDGRPELRETLAELADRDVSADFDGPDGTAWSEEVRRRAAALRAELG